MIYKPTFKSFCGSILYNSTLLLGAAIFTYFVWERSKTTVWLVDGITVLFFIFLLLQAISVHLKKLYIDDRGIATLGPLNKTGIEWNQITSAVLRERKNAISRTDRLLIVTSMSHLLVYNTSILRPTDESEVLEMVKRRTNLVTKVDKPSI